MGYNEGLAKSWGQQKEENEPERGGALRMGKIETDREKAGYFRQRGPNELGQKGYCIFAKEKIVLYKMYVNPSKDGLFCYLLTQKK